MIAYLKGVVAHKGLQGIILDVNGVGYDVLMSTKSMAQLPASGENALVWTYMQVKEDGISLFGFAQQGERDLFLRLIAVNGIGPKMALSALSTYAAAEFVDIISREDTTAVSKIPGVGKKTAQRIILELKGALDSMIANSGVPGASSAFNDALQALIAMGFTAEEASASLKGAPSDLDASALIRGALKNMGGR